MTQTTLIEPFPDGTPARTVQRASLDKQRYISSEAMEQEWEGVWTRCWLFAGLAADIPDAGDFFLYDIGRESIVVIRDDEQWIGAFYNVCQHRGNRIFSAGSGYVNEIACPYHGWRYSLAGALTNVPDEERFTPPVDKGQHSLKPVKVAIWAGMVWVNMDPEAPSFEEYMGSITATLEPYRFENMLLSQHQTVSINANWKTARDNFLEQYHVDFIHPQHATLVDCCNSTNILWPNGHSATQVEGYVTDSRYPVPQETPAHLVVLLEGLRLNPEAFNGRVPDIRKAVQERKRELGKELGYDYGPLSDAQVSDVWQYDFFPNTFMTIQAEELWIYGPRPHPTDPDKCFFDKWTLQIPKELATDVDKGLSLNPSVTVSLEGERPVHEVFTYQDVIDGKHSLTITIDQDIYHLADMQAGMHSRGFSAAVLNEDEVRVQHFHDWLAHYVMRGEELKK